MSPGCCISTLCSHLFASILDHTDYCAECCITWCQYMYVPIDPKEGQTGGGGGHFWRRGKGMEIFWRIWCRSLVRHEKWVDIFKVWTWCVAEVFSFPLLQHPSTEKAAQKLKWHCTWTRFGDSKGRCSFVGRRAQPPRCSDWSRIKA